MPSSVTQFSLQQGELRSTNNELDFAIQGEGFFQIQRPNGQNGYTRDGQFRLNPERVLVTRQGFPLMGEGGPITLRPEGGRISINAEGSVIQGQQIVGKVAVYQIPGDQLERVGDGLLAPKDPAVQPGAIERPNVLNGYVEGSNVTPLNEMVNLIAVSRAYEASQRIITANDENADKAIQILGNPNA
jgi:flagellar basal body rod protein FlgG